MAHEARPAAIVIGAGRAGTTTLDHALGQHPEVATALVKEPSWFVFQSDLPPAAADRRPRHLEDYEALWPADARVTVDTSPAYMDPRHAERSAKLIFDEAPDARLIALLRAPGPRLASCYVNFEGRRDWGGLEDYVERHLHDMSRGLTPYLRLFPRDQLLVLLHEEVIAGNPWSWQRVWRHIGVSDCRPVLEHRNPSGASPAALDGAIRSGRVLATKMVHAKVMPRRAVGWMRTGAHAVRSWWPSSPPPKLTPALREYLARVQQPEVELLCAMLDWDAAKLPQEWRAP